MNKTKTTRLWAGLLGFLAGVATIGLIRSGMELNFAMGSAILFCAVAAAIFALCMDKKRLLLPVLVLRQAVLHGGQEFRTYPRSFRERCRHRRS